MVSRAKIIALIDNGAKKNGRISSCGGIALRCIYIVDAHGKPGAFASRFAHLWRSSNVILVVSKKQKQITAAASKTSLRHAGAGTLPAQTQRKIRIMLYCA